MSVWHTAIAPATVANVGPGYDVLGFALDAEMGLVDTCAARLLPNDDRAHLTIEGDGGRLPKDPEANVATVAARAVLARAGVRTGFELRLTKGLPLGSGLGSSAASAAAAALAINAALPEPMPIEALFDAGRAGEALAAGVPHPDNVVPALAGGFLLLVDRPESGSLEVVRLPVPDALRVAVVIPELVVRTADARRVLPQQVDRGDAVSNMARVGMLVSGLYDGDFDRIGGAIVDRLHQPWRTPLVDGFDAARQAGLAAGALAVGLSGSGPAMFAFAVGDEAARAVGAALAASFEERGIGARFAAGRIAGP